MERLWKSKNDPLKNASVKCECVRENYVNGSVFCACGYVIRCACERESVSVRCACTCTLYRVQVYVEQVAKMC